MSPNYRVEALSKGLQILRLFDENRTSLRMKDISALMGIPMPTVYRLLSTLQSDGFIERALDNTYRPGVAVLTLGNAAIRSSGLLGLCEKPLRELADKTGETINLGVLLGDRVLYLVRLLNSDLVTANIQVGSTLPATFTSMGKVLLSALKDDALSEVVTTSSFNQGAGPNAVAGLAELRTQLIMVRKQGYAIQDEELSPGLRSIAAPLLNGDGKTVAAINIAVPSSRYEVDYLRSNFLPDLIATTSGISASLQRL